MADYDQSVFFTAKDSLQSGDPLKTVRGTELDTEYNAISTAIATKYDSNDLASQAQAEAGTDNSVLMTPLRTTQLVAADASIVPATRTVTAGSGLSGGGALSGDITLTLDGTDERNTDHTAVTFTAGDGLSGGGNIAASRSFSVDIDSLTSTASVADADLLLIHDDSAGAIRKVARSVVKELKAYAGDNDTATTMALTASTWKSVSWTGGASTQIAIPSGTTKVKVSAHVNFAAGTGGDTAYLTIAKNGTNLTTVPEVANGAASGLVTAACLPGVVVTGLVGGTDYLEIEVKFSESINMTSASYSIEYLD